MVRGLLEDALVTTWLLKTHGLRSACVADFTPLSDIDDYLFYFIAQLCLSKILGLTKLAVGLVGRPRLAFGGPCI